MGGFRPVIADTAQPVREGPHASVAPADRVG
jgi:hypothetical protein